MANEIFQEIKTRIALRTGDYAYWTTGAGKDIELLKGEVCVCYLETQPTGQTVTTVPTILFKVCHENGKKFADLDWMSAKAADVYAWAKKSEAEFITWVNQQVTHPSLDAYLKANDITIGSANGTIAVRGTDIAVKGLGSAAYTNSNAYATKAQGDKADSAAATIATYGDIVTHNVSEFATKAQGDKADSAVQAIALAGGTNNGTVKLTVDGKATDNIAVTGLKDAAYTTVSALNATAKSYADAVEAKLPTSANYGVLSVAKGDDTIIVGGTAQNPTIAVAANKFDAYGAAADVQDNLDTYSNAHKDDYTNTKIDELIQGAKNYADSNDADTQYHVEYDSTNKKIKLVAGADASKMEIDAKAFIKDGMISGVALNADHDLVISFNTDAGKEDIEVPLDELIDIYTGVNGTTVNVSVSSDNKISAEVKTGSITDGHIASNAAIAKSKLAADVQTSLGKADSALQSHQDISHLATTAALNKVVDGTTPVAKATNAEKLGDQAPSYYATAASVTDITKTNGIIDSKISAFDATLGDLAKKDNITHDLVTDFDTAVAGVKVNAATNADNLGNAAASDYLKKADAAGYNDILTKTSAATLYQPKGDYATAAQGGKADSALQSIEVGTGLSVTEKSDNKQTISIDTNVVFVLDCNW